MQSTRMEDLGEGGGEGGSEEGERMESEGERRCKGGPRELSMSRNGRDQSCSCGLR